MLKLWYCFKRLRKIRGRVDDGEGRHKVSRLHFADHLPLGK